MIPTNLVGKLSKLAHLFGRARFRRDSFAQRNSAAARRDAPKRSRPLGLLRSYLVDHADRTLHHHAGEGAALVTCNGIDCGDISLGDREHMSQGPRVVVLNRKTREQARRTATT